MTNADTIWLLLPELLLLLLAAWTYVAGAFQPSRNGYQVVALISLALAAFALFRQTGVAGVVSEGSLVSGPLLIDSFGHTVRWLALATGGLLILLTWRGGPPELATEYLGSLALVLCGLMTVCVAGDLAMLFLGLELVTIPTYILLYLGRSDPRSQEATVKYFFLSVLSAALMLYGFAWLYGAAGSTHLADIADGLAEDNPLTSGVPLAIVMIFAGLSFKIAAVPFHFYAPDVYQGASSGNAAVLSVVPKIAGIVALVRILVGAVPGDQWARMGWQMTLAVALLTMTVGNLTALWQRNVRRMMAYSSIAHAGYMLIGLAVALAAIGANSPSGVGLAATLFYLSVYTFATLGTFGVLSCLDRGGQEVEQIDDLAGLGKSRPFLAVAMAVFMFSLTGIPPLAGFWGKLRLLQGALSFGSTQSDSMYGWFLALVIVAVVNAAISAGYYLRVIAVMYFRPAVAPLEERGGRGPLVAVAIAALATVAIGIAPRLLWNQTDQASQSLTVEIRDARHTTVAVEVDPSW